MNILVVDNEIVQIENIRIGLGEKGYRVIQAQSGQEALNLLEDDSLEIDLVITDMTMPGMTGAELAGEMLKLRPDLPIILCSGYSSAIDRDKALALGIREFAVKPLLKKELALLLRRVIAGDAAKR